MVRAVRARGNGRVVNADEIFSGVRAEPRRALDGHSPCLRSYPGGGCRRCDPRVIIPRRATVRSSAVMGRERRRRPRREPSVVPCAERGEVPGRFRAISNGPMSDRCRGEEACSEWFSQPNISYIMTDQKIPLPLADRSSSESSCFGTSSPCLAIILDIASTTHLYKMAAMTSTFLGSAVAAKALLRLPPRRPSPPSRPSTASRRCEGGNIRCSRKTYPQLLTR